MQDHRNKNDFFFVYYTDLLELVIEYYNVAKFDALFQARVPYNMLESLFGTDSISDIYHNIISDINSNFYTIKDTFGETKLFLKNISFRLNKIHENCLFIRIFKKLLFEKEKEISFLKNKIKDLNEKLKKYYSYMKSLKSSENNENHDNNSIKRFNNMYNTSIYLNTPSIDLGFKDQGNELLNNLSSLNFNCLKELSLRTNKISNINPFTNMNFDKLQTLNLYKNQVQDLSPLKKANLVELKNVNLQKNIISDISPLMDLNCCNLQILLLDNNQIENIIPLIKVKFYGLQKLTLDHNLIKDISAFEQVPFKQLKILSLYHNNIKDIRVFDKIISNNLKSFESLWVYHNDFRNNNNDYILNILKKSIKDFL